MIRIIIFSLFLFSFTSCGGGGDSNGNALVTPTIFSAGYPRTMLSFQFVDYLQSQSALITPQELESIYTQTDGFMPTNSTVDEWVQVANAHPDKLAFWFHQGMALSEPRTRYDLVDRSSFFAGHWLHYQSSLINQDVLATINQTVITVADASLFRLVTKNTMTYPDDITLVALDVNGKPDWNITEEVRLVAVDTIANTITVERGQYGTTPLAFTANRAIASAHAMRYWGNPQAIPPKYSWVLNFATDSPMDNTGQRAADVFFNILAPQMQSGGALQSYDGIELDAFTTDPNESGILGRLADTNGDGQGDGGLRTSTNVFELGMYQFVEKLGNAWPDKIITTGDNGETKFVGITNGVELEWWPAWNDTDITRWSTGLNRLAFWTKQAARTPRFTFANHWVGGFGITAGASVPGNIHRLVFAGATMGDAVLTSMYMPLPEADEIQMGFWDEWRQGTDRTFGWLGEPLGAIRRHAAESPDELQGTGISMGQGFLTSMSLSGANLSFDVTTQPGILTVTPTASQQESSMRMTVPGFAGGDLFLRFKVVADKTPEHVTVDIARTLKVALPGIPTTEDAVVHTNEQEVAFYFRGIPAGNTNIWINFEGNAPIHISNMTLHNYPDVTSRLYSNGIVLANPTEGPFVFDLGVLAPGRTYRRLQASSQQAISINDGTAVGTTVSIPARDALFLLQAN